MCSCPRGSEKTSVASLYLVTPWLSARCLPIRGERQTDLRQPVQTGPRIVPRRCQGDPVRTSEKSSDGLRRALSVDVPPDEGRRPVQVEDRAVRIDGRRSQLETRPAGRLEQVVRSSRPFATAGRRSTASGTQPAAQDERDKAAGSDQQECSPAHRSARLAHRCCHDSTSPRLPPCARSRAPWDVKNTALPARLRQQPPVTDPRRDGTTANARRPRAAGPATILRSPAAVSSGRIGPRSLDGLSARSG